MQIRNRYLFHKYGRNYRRIIDTAPEYLELSLEKICLKGKYKSKMTVNRMICDLVTLGLIKKIKGLWNNTKVAQYDCNQYLIKDKQPSTINWNLLSKPKEVDYSKLIKSLSELTPSTMKSKKVKNINPPKIKRPEVEHSPMEKKFLWFLQKGCQDILVDNGILSRHYKSFGSKFGKKVMKSMFPKLLTEILNDIQLRNIFFTVFKPTDVNVYKGEGTFYNTNLEIPRYRAFNGFTFDQVELSNDCTGNYYDYHDVVLKSKQSVREQLFLNNITTTKTNRMTSI